jgi:predicted RND superfamily exporter protein
MPASSTTPVNMQSFVFDESTSKPQLTEEAAVKPSLWRRGVSSWAKFTHLIRYGICQFVVTLSLKAANNPRVCIASVVVVSIAFITTGIFTNFYTELSEGKLFAPPSSLSKSHAAYVSDLEGFPEAQRALVMMIHADGDNVVSYKAMDRLFLAIDAVLDLPEVQDLCTYSIRIGTDGTPYCKIRGASTFWSDNHTLFRQEIQESEELLQMAVSNNTSPAGTPVFHDYYMGNNQRNNDTGLIDFAQSLNLALELPVVPELTLEVELVMLERLFELREEWANEPGSIYKVEFMTARSIPDELMRAITKDVPLVPSAFMVMILFTCFVFFRPNRVQSRTLVGVGSIVTILMSMSTGFGLCFIIGVPFTSMTQILPFIVLGVGLDDTFIITGDYLRTDPNKDTVVRIRETMEEVGMSISMTTITTVVAFILGCFSSIPSVKWVCIYAVPTFTIDFIYQITFFIGQLFTWLCMVFEGTIRSVRLTSRLLTLPFLLLQPSWCLMKSASRPSA